MNKTRHLGGTSPDDNHHLLAAERRRGTREPREHPGGDAISDQPLGQGPALPLKLAQGETRVLLAE